MARNRQPQTECRITLEHHIVAGSGATSAVDREEQKRLTIDIPISLHYDFKMHCTRNQTTMADEIRKLIELRMKHI
jgi:hypothetical protein